MATEEQKQAHLDSELGKITNQLSEMAMTYDSKVLAAALLVKSAAMLRGLYSVGMCSDKEVMGMIQFAFIDVVKPLPLDQRPQIAPFDSSQQRQS